MVMMAQSSTRRPWWKSKDYSFFSIDELVAEMKRREMPFHEPEHKSKQTRAQKSTLIDRLVCNDRGAPHYDSLEDADLLQRVRERGLDRGFQKKYRSWQTHDGLVSLLKNSDKNRKFKPFARLPKDIQLAVYDHYIDALPAEPGTLSMPPLAAVSRGVREDFLTLVFQRANFQLTFIATLDENILPRVEGSEDWLLPSPKVRQLIARMTPEVAARIRKVTLGQVGHYIERRSPHSEEQWVGLKMITIAPRDKNYEVDTELLWQVKHDDDDPGIEEDMCCCPFRDGTHEGRCEPAINLGFREALMPPGTTKNGKGFRVEDFENLVQYCGLQHPW
ncbi:uncharacterized protein LTR77_004501 [Saxophila tyrrhenica]|uniref:Uncharacterized protein n=1 Tax=Saxophila tyrrhenica TaxID=1690608 RepID=A0AAV9PGB7_9PEZI|nr:hypothetical protein LTR77_004501 [Saxophila tyrrhenica]